MATSEAASRGLTPTRTSPDGTKALVEGRLVVCVPFTSAGAAGSTAVLRVPWDLDQKG